MRTPGKSNTCPVRNCRLTASAPARRSSASAARRCLRLVASDRRAYICSPISMSGAKVAPRDAVERRFEPRDVSVERQLAGAGKRAGGHPSRRAGLTAWRRAIRRYLDEDGGAGTSTPPAPCAATPKCLRFCGDRRNAESRGFKTDQPKRFRPHAGNGKNRSLGKVWPAVCRRRASR